MTTSPHDALFRFTFSQPENAAPLIRSKLPAELARRIDWSTLTLQPGSFVDRNLTWRHTDLLFTAKLGDKEAFLYLLLEHQSSPDALMPFRVLRYVVRVWDSALKNAQPAARLPALIPIVVYHGDTPWNAPVRLLDLIDIEPALLPVAAPHLPELCFILDDLGRQSDEALRARAFTHAGELTAHCLAELTSHPDPISLIERWTGLIRALLQARSGTDALVAVLRYALLVTDVAPEALQKTLALTGGDPAVEALMTAAERLTEEARQQGEARGKAEGKAEIVLKQLALRFGALPEAAQNRVRCASIAELERFAESLLSAKTLDEVLR